MLYHDMVGELPKVALEHLVESRYGFTFVDVGLTSSDLAIFDQIDIKVNQDYNQIGELSALEKEVTNFLQRIGENSEDLVKEATRSICQIVENIVSASGRETAWVCLRSFIPSNAHDVPRWHFDGGYYCPVLGKNLVYKFVLTLKGPATLFYPLSRENQTLRHNICIQMGNIDFIQQVCPIDQAIIPERGVGVFFLAANKQKGALHSEPPIHEPRLFFSIAPCYEKELKDLKVRVQDYFSAQ